LNRKKIFKDWLDQIYNPAEGENKCRELLDRLPAHVDAIVQGQDPNGQFADLERHLAECSYCAEMYQELLYLAALEEDGELPEVDDLLANLAGEETAVPTV